MATVIEICNLALSHLRARTINSLTENSTESKACAQFYNILRDQTLEDAPWQFAHKLKPLSVLTDEVYSWQYVYQYPTDCMTINKLRLNWGVSNVRYGQQAYHLGHVGSEVLVDEFQVPYEILNIDDNKVIVSNHCELYVDYRAKVENVNLFPNQFIIALSHLLAAHIAYTIMGEAKGRPLKHDEMTIYQAAIKSAFANNSNEQYKAQSDSEYITSRF